MQQQQNKTESGLNSPLSSASSSIIPTAAVVSAMPTTVTESQQSNSQTSLENTSESQLNDTDPIYPPLKDCQVSLDKIIHDLTSSMWSNGIIQLLKTKNILTIGDLCQLKTKEINELPFKTPKVENFMKVIQKFNASLKQVEETTQAAVTNDVSTPPVVIEAKKDEQTIIKTTKQTTPMGSLEEEMAKLEEANSLDTSIECESLNIAEKCDNESETDQELLLEPVAAIEPTTKPSSYDKILDEINSNLVNPSLNLNISELTDKFTSLETSDLIKLMNYINTINLKIAQVNNLVLDKLKSK